MQVFSYEDLSQFTDEFSAENFIENFQFGKMYHGKIGSRAVTLNIFEKSETYYDSPGVRELMDELTLLRHPEFILHPTVVKLVGYCCEDENLGVLYDLDSLDTIVNLLREESFTWMRRIKVALGVARLLEFLHSTNGRYRPYAVGNINPNHVMVDKEYNPIWYEFGMFTGGILPARRHSKFLQLYFWNDGDSFRIAGASAKNDVLSFGKVLLTLITMRSFEYPDGPSFDYWTREYDAKVASSADDKRKCSLVHPSLVANPGFYYEDGTNITGLAMQCMKLLCADPPSMRQVVSRMLKLRIVRKHAKALGFD